MKLAIDTNAYVDFCKGDHRAVSIIKSVDDIYFPYICLGELRAGFICGTQSLSNERNLSRFLNSSRVHVLYADDQTTHHYARLFFQLKKQGTPIPMNDLWIASLVIQHSLHLLSKDRYFEYLPQIPTLS
jgi:tRNA(fMet)-specific endonuclease VapC